MIRTYVFMFFACVSPFLCGRLREANAQVAAVSAPPDGEYVVIDFAAVEALQALDPDGNRNYWLKVEVVSVPLERR